MKVRETGAKISCANNLKQMGIALHSYHMHNSHFPPGVICSSLPKPIQYRWIPGYWFSWGVFLLPHLDQEVLYNNIDWSISPYLQPLCTYQQKVYTCLSDARSHKSYLLAGNDNKVTSYQGVLGQNQYLMDGVLPPNNVVNINYIIDGTSNTIAIGDRPASREGWWGWWVGGYGVSPYRGSTDVILGTSELEVNGVNIITHNYGPGDLENDVHVYHYWSFHDGGCNFLFIDGHVSFLGYQSKLNQLATINGND